VRPARSRPASVRADGNAWQPRVSIAGHSRKDSGTSGSSTVPQLTFPFRAVECMINAEPAGVSPRLRGIGAFKVG
jgi:hypothetical protein